MVCLVDVRWLLGEIRRGVGEEMSADELKEIRARAERATPGPWEAKGNRLFANRPAPPGGRIMDYETRTIIDERESVGVVAEFFAAAPTPEYILATRDNAQFLAHARADIPALLSRIVELEGALEKIADGVCMDDVAEYDIGGCNLRCEKVARAVLGREP